MHMNIFEYSLVGGRFNAHFKVLVSGVFDQKFSNKPHGRGSARGDMGGFVIDWYRNDLKSSVMNAPV